jgi:predicted neuraminidase
LPDVLERTLSGWHRTVFVVATIATAVVALGMSPGEDSEAPNAVTPRSQTWVRHVPTNDVVPFFSEDWVSPSGHTASAHSSALCPLPGGDLLAVWYGGSREGAADVALFTARFVAAKGEWLPPLVAVDRATAQQELDRVIKKVGNAVIFPNQTGGLWLVYVSVSMGGWSGSALNLKTSHDEGRTWSESQRLTLNPFLNLSTLVRNKPIYSDDGRIGLPVYHEMALKYPQMLWLTPGPLGAVQDYRMRNLASETGLIQPALVPLGQDRVLMMLRDRRRLRQLHTAYSEDNGWTWSDAAPTVLPNPDSAVDGLQLRDGRILLVYNHAHQGRDNLRIAISSDAGRHWSSGPILESAPRQEYSYPFLVEDARGRVHLTYTWQRTRIKHVTFNIAWLDRSSPSASLAEP